MRMSLSTTIGIIGTAGRKEDSDKLSAALYQKMKLETLKLIMPYTNKEITFVSGGAAVADHLAVHFFNTLPHTKLSLHLPAPFDQHAKQFVEEKGKMFNPGNIANYYHRKFQKWSGINSLGEIALAIEEGATVLVTPGFKQRNSKVAAGSEVLIALTFGEGALLKDGGTADTFGKFLAKQSGISHHICLPECQVFSPGLIEGFTPKPTDSQPSLF